VREDAAGAEFEVFDFAGRRNAVVGGAGDGQLRLGEQFGGEMGLAEHQGGAHGQRGLATGEELLALDVELGVEAVVFGVVGELRERGEGAGGIADDEVLRAGLVRERNGDAAEFFIDGEFAALKPCDGVFDGLVLFIEHEDQIARGAGLLKSVVLAGADEGAAAAAAADEFDDPGPAFAFEVGELRIFAACA
jgi:hypothetical protein